MVKFNKYDNNGSILVSYSVNGKRIRKTFKNENDADEFIKDEKKNLRVNEAFSLLQTSGLDIDKNIKKVKIADAIKEVLEHRFARTDDLKNFKQERYNYKYFYEYFFDKKIDFVHEITIKEIEKYQEFMQSSGLSWSTNNRRITTLKSFLNRCVLWEYIKENPCEKVKPMSGKSKSRKVWTSEQVNLVMSKLDPGTKNFFTALHLHGARHKELTNLLWTDVDFKNHRIRFESKKGKGSIARERYLPLTESQVEFYEQIKNDQKRNFRFKNDGNVFLQVCGSKIDSNLVSKKIRKIREELGLDSELVSYGLRHTLLTMLAEQNVSQSKLSLIAGHAKSETTQKYYIHHSEKSLLNVISLGERLRKSAT